MAQEKKKKIVSKKEISRLSRERRQRQMILIGSIVVFVLVVTIVAYGIFNELVFQGLKAVAKVNSEKITINEYQKEVRYQRFQAIQQYRYYYQVYQIYQQLDPEGLGASLKSNLQQIEYQLSDTNKVQFGNDVLDQMVNNLLIAQYARENKITVSQQEIDEALQALFGYYAAGIPTPTQTATPFSTSTLSALQYQLVSPTPTFTPTVEATSVPDQTNTPETTPVQTEAASAEPAPVTDYTSTPTLEPTLTPTQYTFDGYEANLISLLDRLGEIELSRSDLENTFRSSLLREKVFEVVTKDVTAEQEQVWARHILVADETTALEVLKKLDAGEDWTLLAAEYSLDESNKNKGGDLGWFGSGQMVLAFEEAAFKLKIGEISQPVKSDSGYHIIQVLGHEVRPISSSALQSLKNQNFSTWLENQKAEGSVTTYDTWQEDIPTIPTIPPELLIES